VAELRTTIRAPGHELAVISSLWRKQHRGDGSMKAAASAGRSSRDKLRFHSEAYAEGRAITEAMPRLMSEGPRVRARSLARADATEMNFPIRCARDLAVFDKQGVLGLRNPTARAEREIKEQKKARYRRPQGGHEYAPPSGLGRVHRTARRPGEDVKDITTGPRAPITRFSAQ